MKKKVLIFANTDWFLYNFRLQLALAMKDEGYDILLVSPYGEYVERLKSAGFAWRNFTITRRGMNPFRELLTVLSLMRLYRHEKPDLVIHYTIKCVIYGSIAAKLAGITTILNTITGLGYVFTRQKKHDVLKWLVKTLYRVALADTEVVFISQEDMQLFQEEKMVKHQSVTLIESCGVDIGKFSLDRRVKQKEIVLFAGRILRDKGIAEFAEMAKIIKEQGRSTRFVIVGKLDSGNPSNLDCEVLQEWQRENLVEFWGWQDDMVKVYQQAEIVCLPSYQEGIPRTLLEAAACERPIVTTDVPGCRDVVHHQVNGFLVPARDPGALAEAVLLLLDDKELRVSMGKKGREMVSERFSDVQVVRETLLLLSKIDYS